MELIIENINDHFIWYGLAFGAVLLIFGYIYEKKRSEALILVAHSLGFTFDKLGRDLTRKIHDDFFLFSLGDNYTRDIKNEMWGVLDGLQISIFGYQYTVGFGRNSRTYKQTVLSIECTSTVLPEFVLRPENLMHKIGQIFGYKDIDFESSYTFSDSYLLQGDNEDEIRKIFTNDVLSYFASNLGLSVESKNNLLLFYRDSKRCNPKEIERFCSEGRELHKVICATD